MIENFVRLGRRIMLSHAAITVDEVFKVRRLLIYCVIEIEC